MSECNYLPNSRIDLLEIIINDNVPLKKRIEAERKYEFIDGNPEHIKSIRHYMKKTLKQ